MGHIHPKSCIIKGIYMTDGTYCNCKTDWTYTLKSFLASFLFTYIDVGGVGLQLNSIFKHRALLYTDVVFLTHTHTYTHVYTLTHSRGIILLSQQYLRRRIGQ